MRSGHKCGISENITLLFALYKPLSNVGMDYLTTESVSIENSALNEIKHSMTKVKWCIIKYKSNFSFPTEINETPGQMIFKLQPIKEKWLALQIYIYIYKLSIKIPFLYTVQTATFTWLQRLNASFTIMIQKHPITADAKSIIVSPRFMPLFKHIYHQPLICPMQHSSKFNSHRSALQNAGRHTSKCLTSIHFK